MDNVVRLPQSEEVEREISIARSREVYRALLSPVDPPDGSDMEEVKIGDDIVYLPADTLVLEPRSLYDKALLGVAHQAGVNYAVYSRKEAVTLTIEDALTDETDDPDRDPETEAYEHFEFNVSGSIGIGFPVFMLDED